MPKKYWVDIPIPRSGIRQLRLVDLIDIAQSHARECKAKVEASDNIKNAPQHATMPPMRSMGFALIRPGRHADFDSRRQAAVTRQTTVSMDDAELTADCAHCAVHLDAA